MIWISKKSGICLPQVLDLFFLIKELCEQVRDLWSVPHAVSGLAGQADISRQKCRNPMWRGSFRARKYTVFISSKKVFTPSHSLRFLLIFMGFDCEGLDFKAFTLVSVSAMLVSIHQKNIAQAFILERYFFVSIYPAVIPGLLWTIESTSIHTEKHWESVGKQHKNL